jgi:long-chain acyl-CoA synthetase
MSLAPPYPWEKSYPAGVRWDVPIETTSLGTLLDGAAEAYAERPALEYRERLISYSELNSQSERAAAALASLGIGRGSRVALYLPNSPYHLFGFFGAMRIGATIVHLSALDAERELAYKLADSGARTLITINTGPLLATAMKLKAAGHLDHVLVGDEAVWGAETTQPLPPGAESFNSLIDRAAPPAAWPEVGAADIALIQYTGGTTGKPKGAMLSHGNLTAAVASYRAWATGENAPAPGLQKVIAVLPLFHIYGLCSVVLRHLTYGNLLMLRPRFDVETILHDIEVKRATVFPGVPTMWIALANVPDIDRRDLSSLRSCASGGAALPVDVAERFERLTGLWIGGGWGMTESSPAGANLPRHDPGKPGALGVPLPGIVMDVVSLDDPRRNLPPGEVGELRIRGANVFQGYWNRPEETAAAFVDGCFLTGDIGYMDEDGYLFLVDRKKDMIISGGFNIYPQMIEEAVYEHPQVEECLVVGVPDEYRGESAKAFVKLRQGAPGFTLDELHAFLSDKLGRHELPRELEIRDALPRTAVGKLSKVALREEERAKHRAKLRRSA